MILKNKSIRRLISICLLTFLLYGCGEDPSVLASWEHSHTGLNAAEISLDGRLAVVTGYAEGTRLWNLEKDQLLYKWSHGEAAESTIASVAISPNGSHVITADKRTFVVWATKTGKALGYWQVDADIMDVAISNEGRFVLLGLKDGRAIHINQQTQRRLEVVANRQERVTTVDLSADGVTAITGGNDGRVVAWNANTGKEVHTFEHQTRVALVSLDQKNRQLMSSDEKGHAYIWNLKTGKQISQLKLKSRQTMISSARFSSNGKELLTGFPARDLVLWNSQTGEAIKKWRAPKHSTGWRPASATVYAVAFADKGKSIVAEASSGLGQRWRLN